MRYSYEYNLIINSFLITYSKNLKINIFFINNKLIEMFCEVIVIFTLNIKKLNHVLFTFNYFLFIYFFLASYCQDFLSSEFLMFFFLLS